MTAPTLPLRTLAALANAAAWVANEALERVGSALDTRVCQLGNDLSRREDD